MFLPQLLLSWFCIYLSPHMSSGHPDPVFIHAAKPGNWCASPSLLLGILFISIPTRYCPFGTSLLCIFPLWHMCRCIDFICDFSCLSLSRSLRTGEEWQLEKFQIGQCSYRSSPNTALQLYEFGGSLRVLYPLISSGPYDGGGAIPYACCLISCTHWPSEVSISLYTYFTEAENQASVI